MYEGLKDVLISLPDVERCSELLLEEEKRREESGAKVDKIFKNFGVFFGNFSKKNFEIQIKI